jgi:hypothetical protein
VRRLLLLLGAVTLVAGCAHGVTGVAQPAKSALTFLPTEDEMTAAAGNRLSSFGFQPFVGGLEIMPDGFRTDADAEPIRCVGVTDTMTRVTYEPADVLEAARQSYFTLAEGVGVSGADAAVIRFATAAAAARTYDSFVARWKACAGQTVVKHLRGVPGSDVEAMIGDVTATGSMVTAAVTTRQGTDGPVSHYERAVAVRGDTIVEVSLAVERVGNDRTAPADAAARAAQAMVDKVRVGS